MRSIVDYGRSHVVARLTITSKDCMTSAYSDILARIEAGIEASRAVFARFTPGAVETEYKISHDPVTEADRAVDAVLRQNLLRDGEGWLSEETVDNPSRLGKERVWIVDPLDGTREFVKGLPEFCVSIGFAENGRPVAGGIYNPATQETFLGAIDTGVLFPQTLATWRAFEERFGLEIEVLDARSEDEPWTASCCCGAAKVDALERGLEGVEAWITGIRREQASSREGAHKLERDERRGIWKVNPLVDWTEQDLWRYINKHDLPYHPLHDEGYGSIGCEPCTRPGGGREGRWAGQDKTECGIHV